MNTVSYTLFQYQIVEVKLLENERKMVIIYSANTQTGQNRALLNLTGLGHYHFLTALCWAEWSLFQFNYLNKKCYTCIKSLDCKSKSESAFKKLAKRTLSPCLYGSSDQLVNFNMWYIFCFFIFLFELSCENPPALRQLQWSQSGSYTQSEAKAVDSLLLWSIIYTKASNGG